MPPMAAVGAYMIPTGVFTFLCPLGAYRSSGIKLPYLVGGGYVDVEPAQDVELVVSHCKPPGRIVPAASPGQLSPPVSVVTVSVTGL